MGVTAPDSLQSQVKKYKQFKGKQDTCAQPNFGLLVMSTLVKNVNKNFLIKFLQRLCAFSFKIFFFDTFLNHILLHNKNIHIKLHTFLNQFYLYYLLFQTNKIIKRNLSKYSFVLPFLSKNLVAFTINAEDVSFAF